MAEAPAVENIDLEDQNQSEDEEIDFLLMGAEGGNGEDLDWTPPRIRPSQDVGDGEEETPAPVQAEVAGGAGGDAVFQWPDNVPHPLLLSHVIKDVLIRLPCADLERCRILSKDWNREACTVLRDNKIVAFTNLDAVQNYTNKHSGDFAYFPHQRYELDGIENILEQTVMTDFWNKFGSNTKSLEVRIPNTVVTLLSLISQHLPNVERLGCIMKYPINFPRFELRQQQEGQERLMERLMADNYPIEAIQNLEHWGPPIPRPAHLPPAPPGAGPPRPQPQNPMPRERERERDRERPGFFRGPAIAMARWFGLNQEQGNENQNRNPDPVPVPPPPFIVGVPAAVIDMNNEVMAQDINVLGPPQGPAEPRQEQGAAGIAIPRPPHARVDHFNRVGRRLGRVGRERRVLRDNPPRDFDRRERPGPEREFLVAAAAARINPDPNNPVLPEPEPDPALQELLTQTFPQVKELFLNIVFSHEQNDLAFKQLLPCFPNLETLGTLENHHTNALADTQALRSNAPRLLLRAILDPQIELRFLHRLEFPVEVNNQDLQALTNKRLPITKITLKLVHGTRSSGLKDFLLSVSSTLQYLDVSFPDAFFTPGVTFPPYTQLRPTETELLLRNLKELIMFNYEGPVDSAKYLRSLKKLTINNARLDTTLATIHIPGVDYRPVLDHNLLSLKINAYLPFQLPELESLWKVFPWLRTLQVHGIDNNGLGTIYRHLPYIMHLEILDAEVTDRGICGVADEVCRDMAETGTFRIVDPSKFRLDLYVGSMQYLKTFKLKAEEITDISVFFGIVDCTNLESLTLEGSKITDTSLFEIANRMCNSSKYKIKHLDFHNCPNISEEGKFYLKEKMKRSELVLESAQPRCKPKSPSNPFRQVGHPPRGNRGVAERDQEYHRFLHRVIELRQQRQFAQEPGRGVGWVEVEGEDQPGPVPIGNAFLDAAVGGAAGPAPPVVPGPLDPPGPPPPRFVFDMDMDIGDDDDDFDYDEDYEANVFEFVDRAQQIQNQNQAQDPILRQVQIPQPPIPAPAAPGSPGGRLGAPPAPGRRQLSPSPSSESDISVSSSLYEEQVERVQPIMNVLPPEADEGELPPDPDNNPPRQNVAQCNPQ